MAAKSIWMIAAAVVLVQGAAGASAGGPPTTSTGDIDQYPGGRGAPPAVDPACLADLDPNEVDPEEGIEVPLDCVGLAGGLVEICAQVITQWAITLTLLGPAPGDHVAVAVLNGLLSDADVATHDRPAVVVRTETNTGCAPGSVVTGLVVDGQLPYTLEYETHQPCGGVDVAGVQARSGIFCPLA